MPVNADFLAEKGADFGLATGPDTILYCGAYILSEFKPQESRVYTANESYWDRGNVFIGKIEQTYNKEATTLAPELYRRGEIDAAAIDNTIAAEWLADPETADLIHPIRNTSFYSYFFCFNFDAQFDAEY
jgi:oligopeptide transport system substrate-binding protein